MKFSRSENERGSFSLGMIYSTGAGVLFLLVFYNLTNFIAATGAVSEAARLTARCVTPTDPECVEVVSSGESLSQREWYGYPAGPESQAVDVSLMHLDYSSSMQEQTWGASYRTHEILSVEQTAELNSFRVPLKTYRTIAPREIPYGSNRAVFIDSTSSDFRPRFEPNFPKFEQDTSASASRWLSSNRPFNWHHRSTSRHIGPSETVSVSLGPITVPELPDVGVSACQTSAGRPCDNSRPAGAGRNEDSWRTHAFIAIKAMSRVRATEGRTTVQWKDSHGGAGLYVEITDRNGQRSRRCLGGRAAFKNLGTDSRGYNMWLRGPSGSHGGTKAICPGGVRHDRLAVARGGSFKVIGFLRNDGRNAAAADITLAAYFDDYLKSEKPKVKVVCQSQTYRGEDAASSCSQALSDCRPDCALSDTCDISQSSSWRFESCRIEEAGFEETCEVGPKTRASSTAVASAEVRAAVCRASFQPDAAAEEVPFCGWEQIAEETIEVASVPRNCPLATAQKETSSCEKRIPYRARVTRERCGNIFKAAEKLSRDTEELNAAQPPGAPKFARKAKVDWQEQSKPSWEFSWIPVDTGSPDTRKAVRHELPAELGIKRFKAISGDKPPAYEQLLSSILVHSPGDTSAYGWQQYRENIAQFVRPIKISEEKKAIDAVYPFIEPVREIYYGQTDPTRGWDFNRDCIRDTYCSFSPLSFGSEEEMLRHFAAKQIPEAADSSLEFNYAAKPSGIEHFSSHSQSAVRDLDLPECTPTRTICQQVPSSDAKLTALGQHAEKPEVCKNGQFFNCYSQDIGNAYSEVSSNENIDIAKAKQVGLDEIKNIIPYAFLAESCGDSPSCASITVDAETADHARVTVDYNLPLSFPMDLILRRRTVKISTVKEEVIERRMLD